MSFSYPFFVAEGAKITPMRELPRFNCVSFVYFHQGIIEREEHIEGLRYRDLLKHFTRVPEIVFADVVAVIVPTGEGPGVAHLALVNRDRQTITHRMGINKPVTEGPIEEDLETYTRRDEAEVVFLARK